MFLYFLFNHKKNKDATNYLKLYTHNNDNNDNNKYYMSRKLSAFCNRNINEKVYRFEILDYIFKYLKENYQYSYEYYGEDDTINELIGIDKSDCKNEDIIISHHSLQMKLLKHFKKVK